MLRFVVIAAVFVAIAVAAPRFAPLLLSSLVDNQNPPVATEPMMEESVTAAAPPVPDVPSPGFEPDTQRLPEIVEKVQVLDGRRVVVQADAGGHYVVEARVNGRALTAMVDTGATTVALSAETARRLGILPPRSAFVREIATANGIVKAAPVMLLEVRIGNIAVRDVEAVVILGDALTVDLLGMSFLGRLGKLESAAGRLTLTQ